MEDQMKKRLYRLQRTLKTCDDWQVPILKEEIADLKSYLKWRDNRERQNIGDFRTPLGYSLLGG